MRVLIITTEWPRFDGDIVGIHVVHQISSLRQAGLDADVFPVRGQKNPLNYWHASRDLNRLDLEKYDVIHAHHGQSGIVALSQHKRPVVVTFHGSDLQGIRDLYGRITLLGYVLRLSSRWVAHRANAVIVVSEHLARYLGSRVNYHVIPAGIDMELFCPMLMAEARLVLGLPPTERLILFVGNPERTEKRFWLAEQAVAVLAEKMDVKLILAHDISHQQMPFFMNACDVLLVTSSTEGSPSVVKEALACNLPIVSTDVGDIRQRIFSVAGCHICADDQPETIAEALGQVIYHSSGRIAGRETVLEFNETDLIRKVIALYEGLACPI